MKRKLYLPMILAYVILLVVVTVVTIIFLDGKEIAATDPLYYSLIKLAGVVYLLSFLIFLFYGIFIVRPLNRIIDAAKEYSAGNFEKQIEVSPRADIGRLAATMNYMAHELDSLEEDQRKFISNVSHDFRSPLTSIKGFAEAMADGTIPPEMQEKYLKIIIFETERLTKLTENLLELNKIGGKGFYLDISTFDINELIDRTCESFEGRCREKNITIRVGKQYEKMLVKADASKIDQVLHNLIDNALKFSNPDSEIVITTSMKAGKVYTSVKDNGAGIPRESINKIWERFYKTDPSRGRDKKGTGLGLSIVKEIIQAHKENINVISTEGVGTEFIFTLPAA